MTLTYAEQLRDPRWQKKRLEIFKRDEFACARCQSTNVELHVHHRIYIRNKPLWDVGDDNLVTLCADCHAAVTDLKNKIGAVLDFDPHFDFFDNCFCSIGKDNWVEIQAVFSKLCGLPKEVDRLFKKFYKNAK